MRIISYRILLLEYDVEAFKSNSLLANLTISSYAKSISGYLKKKYNDIQDYSRQTGNFVTLITFYEILTSYIQNTRRNIRRCFIILFYRVQYKIGTI